MNTILKVFKYLAYLQLVFLAGALYFIYEPLILQKGKEAFIAGFSNGLILIGFAFSLLSLRDLKKIDSIGRGMIERPKLFKWIVFVTITISIISLIIGVWLIVDAEKNFQLGIGLTSFGVGYLALIKSLIDQAKDLTDHY